MWYEHIYLRTYVDAFIKLFLWSNGENISPVPYVVSNHKSNETVLKIRSAQTNELCVFCRLELGRK